jgi:hypothetical protein
MWCGADAGLFLLDHFRQVLMIEPGLAALRHLKDAHDWEVSRTTLVDIEGAEELTAPISRHRLACGGSRWPTREERTDQGDQPPKGRRETCQRQG